MSRGRQYETETDRVVLRTPERDLWMAVIERALKDYCFFFEKVLQTGNGHLIRYEGLSEHDARDFSMRCIAELSRLRWFLFDATPTPFNLEYLSNELYDDNGGMAQCIRKEAQKQFNLHVQSQQIAGRFPDVIKYVTENWQRDFSDAASKRSKLSYKRYR
jgi:hypothetical protein